MVSPRNLPLFGLVKQAVLELILGPVLGPFWGTLKVLLRPIWGLEIGPKWAYFDPSGPPKHP